jgi:putative membrane protein
MDFAIKCIVGCVTLLHIYFLVLEMFLWTTPKGLKIFGQKLEQAQASAKLAANQGLYNGFLAAGLVWGLLTSDSDQARSIEIFFLSCVTIAGLYGAYSVSRKILYVQALPAVVGLILILLGTR